MGAVHAMVKRCLERRFRLVWHICRPSCRRISFKIGGYDGISGCFGSRCLVPGNFFRYFCWGEENRAPDHITRIIAVSGATTPVLVWNYLIDCFWANLGIAPIGRSDATIFASIAHPTGLYTIDAILAGSQLRFGMLFGIYSCRPSHLEILVPLRSLPG